MTDDEVLAILAQRNPGTASTTLRKWLRDLQQAYFGSVPNASDDWPNNRSEVNNAIASHLSGSTDLIGLSLAVSDLPAPTSEEAPEQTFEERRNEQFLTFVLSAAEAGLIDLQDEVDADLSQVLQNAFFELMDDFEDNPIAGSWETYVRQNIDSAVAEQGILAEQASAERIRDAREAEFQRIAIDAVNSIAPDLSAPERVSMVDSVLEDILSRVALGEEVSSETAEILASNMVTETVGQLREQAQQEQNARAAAGQETPPTPGVLPAPTPRTTAAPGSQTQMAGDRFTTGLTAEQRALQERNAAGDGLNVEFSQFLQGVDDRDFANFLAGMFGELTTQFQQAEEARAAELEQTIQRNRSAAGTAGITTFDINGLNPGGIAPQSFADFLSGEQEGLQERFREQRRTEARRRRASAPGRSRVFPGT